jgi:hypothetical protein
MTCKTNSKTLNAGAALLWAALCVGVTTCGEDKTETADASTPGRNKCFSPGIGGNCMCGIGRNGTNTCGEDGYWTTCQCVSRPDGALCTEGERLECQVICPGESVARLTRCVDGKYDCSCADAGATTTKRDAGS